MKSVQPTVNFNYLRIRYAKIEKEKTIYTTLYQKWLFSSSSKIVLYISSLLLTKLVWRALASLEVALIFTWDKMPPRSQRLLLFIYQGVITPTFLRSHSYHYKKIHFWPHSLNTFSGSRIEDKTIHYQFIGTIETRYITLLHLKLTKTPNIRGGHGKMAVSV